MASIGKQTGKMAQGADLFLDILTKEEKEALLNKKMEEIRRKNEALRKRHEEIEADKRLAEKKGMAIPPKAATSTPQPQSQPQPQAPPPQGPPPRKDQKGMNGEKKPSKFAAGRGKRLVNMSKEKLKAQDYERKKPGGPGPRQHGPQMHVQQGGSGPRAPPEPKSPVADGPPPDPAFNFLADRSREGPLSTDVRWESKRHPRNFGGSNLHEVKSRIQVDREKQGRHQGGPPRSKRELEIKMTGRERREYLEWKAERDRIDQERVERQKRSSGDWKREWDREKDEFAPPPSPPSPRRTEPGRRPAGRIGSGRFALGEQGECPSGGWDTAATQPTSPGFHDSHDTRHLYPSGSRGRDSQRQEAPQAGFHDQHANRHPFSSTPRRGRGGRSTRGGGRGGHQERPPRMRVSSSGSEDGNRSVEKQNDSLVVKIENEFATPSSGPHVPEQKRSSRGSKPVRGKAGHSRGAGGGSGRIRPPRVSPGSSSSEGGVIDIPVTTSTWKPNPEAAEFKLSTTAGSTWTATTASTGQVWDMGQIPVNPADVAQYPHVMDLGPQRIPVVDAGSQEADYEGQGGEEEWEDAEDSTEFYKFTEVEAEYEYEEDLHNSSAESLERFIQEHTLELNVDSTGITPVKKKKGGPQLTPVSQTSPTSPTSPGVIKTPEGHVNVLDWAAEVEQNSRGSNASDLLTGANTEDLSISSGVESSSGVTPEKRRGDGTVDTSLEGDVVGSLAEAEYQVEEEENDYEDTADTLEILESEEHAEEYVKEGVEEEIEDDIEEGAEEQEPIHLIADEASKDEASREEALPDSMQQEDVSSAIPVEVGETRAEVSVEDGNPQAEDAEKETTQMPEDLPSCGNTEDSAEHAEVLETKTEEQSQEVSQISEELSVGGSTGDAENAEVLDIKAAEDKSSLPPSTAQSEVTEDSAEHVEVLETKTEEQSQEVSQTSEELSVGGSPGDAENAEVLNIKAAEDKSSLPPSTAQSEVAEDSAEHAEVLEVLETKSEQQSQEVSQTSEELSVDGSSGDAGNAEVLDKAAEDKSSLPPSTAQSEVTQTQVQLPADGCVENPAEVMEIKSEEEKSSSSNSAVLEQQQEVTQADPERHGTEISETNPESGNSDASVETSENVSSNIQATNSAATEIPSDLESVQDSNSSKQKEALDENKEGTSSGQELDVNVQEEEVEKNIGGNVDSDQGQNQESGLEQQPKLEVSVDTHCGQEEQRSQSPVPEAPAEPEIVQTEAKEAEESSVTAASVSSGGPNIDTSAPTTVDNN